MTDIPGQKQTETALETIVGQGVLGSLTVILIVALFLTIKALLKSKDDRIQDQKLMSDALGRYAETAKELAIEMNKAASNMLVEQNRNLDHVKNTLSNQDRSLVELRGVIGGLQTEQTYLKHTIGNLKCGGKG